MTMYLPNRDVLPTGYEPAEFIEPAEFRPSVERRPSTIELDEEEAEDRRVGFVRAHVRPARTAET